MVVLTIVLVATSQFNQAASAFFLNAGSISLSRASLEYGTTARQDEHAMHRDRASTLLRAALHWDPSNASAYRLLGRVAAEEGDYEGAVGHYLQSTRIRKHPMTHNDLGNAYHALGQQDLAIASWARIGEPLAQYHLELGVDYFTRGMLDEAEEELRVGLQLGDLTAEEKARAFRFLSAVSSGRGELREAILYLRRAIEVAPDQAQLYASLALALVQTGEFDDAVAAASRAIELDPNLPAPHRYLASAYINKVMYSEAIREYQQSLLLDPNNLWAHYELGLAYWGTGNREEAILEWRTALTIDPSFEPARRALEASLITP